MSRTVVGISDEAVAEATGHGWDHWLTELDRRGADDLDHRVIVATLAALGVERPWWRQTVANGYEVERGLREVGETADAGYQVGVQRTVRVERQRLWDWLVTGDGLAVWLGDVSGFGPEPGTAYESSDGTSGEVRTVKPGERLRLTWQPPDRDGPTTLQLTLACPRNDDSKTTLRVHHERLADADERAAMRSHWSGVLDEVETLVADG